MEENGMIDMNEMKLVIGKRYKITDKITRKVYRGRLLYWTSEGICIGYNNISDFWDFDSVDIEEVKK